jgi:hypothetical protein
MKPAQRPAVLVALALALTVTSGLAQPNQGNQPVYGRGGFSSMVAMGQTLQKNLPPKYRDLVHSRPVNLQTDLLPYVRPEQIQYADMAKPWPVVFISVGFVELVNYVAHAKAIDRMEKGFFLKYVLSLSQDTGEKGIPQLPRLAEPRFWTDPLVNEQESTFNQMVGIVLAIELSHHYLGHFAKYQAMLTGGDGKAIPLNRLLQPVEWEAAVKAGTRHALRCGYGIDGVLALYEAIEKMPQRPAWTVYFLPEGVKVAKLKRDLKRLEGNFFLGLDKD